MLPPLLCLPPRGHGAASLAPLIAALEALGARAFAIDTLAPDGTPLDEGDAEARVAFALRELDQRCELVAWGDALGLALTTAGGQGPYLSGITVIAGDGPSPASSTVPLAYLALEDDTFRALPRQYEVAEALGADPVLTLTLGSEPLATAASHLADALIGIATTRASL